MRKRPAKVELMFMARDDLQASNRFLDLSKHHSEEAYIYQTAMDLFLWHMVVGNEDHTDALITTTERRDEALQRAAYYVKRARFHTKRARKLTRKARFTRATR